MVFFGCFSRRKDSKLGNEFVQRREIFLIWENWLWLFCHFLRTWKPKKQKDTAPKTLLGFLPNVEIVGNEQIPKHARAWTWNFTVLWDFSSFASKNAGRNPATWKNVNSLGKLPTLAGWKHPISETIHRKCQGLHVIFKKKQHHHHHNRNNNKKKKKKIHHHHHHNRINHINNSMFLFLAAWHPGISTQELRPHPRLGDPDCMAPRPAWPFEVPILGGSNNTKNIAWVGNIPWMPWGKIIMTPG